MTVIYKVFYKVNEDHKREIFTDCASARRFAKKKSKEFSESLVLLYKLNGYYRADGSFHEDESRYVDSYLNGVKR